MTNPMTAQSLETAGTLDPTRMAFNHGFWDGLHTASGRFATMPEGVRMALDGEHFDPAYQVGVSYGYHDYMRTQETPESSTDAWAEALAYGDL